MSLSAGKCQRLGAECRLKCFVLRRGDQHIGEIAGFWHEVAAIAGKPRGCHQVPQSHNH
jgi:hypothetical protein